MPVSVKALAFPVAHRHWLLYAWRSGEMEASELAKPEPGVAGFFKSLPDRAVSTAQAQWTKLSKAREGTFQNWLYKCAAARLVQHTLQCQQTCRPALAHCCIVVLLQLLLLCYCNYYIVQHVCGPSTATAVAHSRAAQRQSPVLSQVRASGILRTSRSSGLCMQADKDSAVVGGPGGGVLQAPAC